MGSPRDCWAGSPSSTGRPDKPAAQRWKTQVNENAKMPAWWSVLPELDHNEIVGWETLPSLTRDVVGIVSLTDIGDHARFETDSITRRNSPRAVPWIGEVRARQTRICPVDVTHGHRGPRVLHAGRRGGCRPSTGRDNRETQKLLVKD